jgi:GNAT superfamily N-acetyltransferase
MFAAIGGFSEADLEAADLVYRRWIRPRLRSGRAWAVVARARGRAVGSAVVWLRDDQPRPGSPALRIPYILSVFVDPDFRGQGIASGMTQALVGWAARRGYPRVVLHASGFGRSVYRRLGFERTWEMRFGGPYRSGPERSVPADENPSSADRPAPRRPGRSR